jgi:hypothetical protein
MVKRCIPLALALVVACTPRIVEKTPQPRLVVDNPVWEFGTMERGDTVTTWITLANTSSEPVSVSLYSTCDCLIPATETDRIDPADRSRIRLIYIGDEIKDKVTKTLYIDVDDTTGTRVSVTVTGQVTPGTAPHIVVLPNPLPVAMSETAEALLTLTNRGGQMLRIGQVGCFGCLSGWTSREIEAGEEIPLPIEILPDWSGRRWIEIESNDPVTPSKKISIITLE